MPVQRISKAFKDVSATFQVNPINSDVIILRNENAIARSIRNLVFTIPGEKPFEPTIGSNVTNLLFENLDFLTASSIRSEIENTINNFEPRVRLREVEVNPNFDNNAFDVVIRYDIIGIDVAPQQLSFALQPTR
ncbi:baseplate wedge subunit [Synechococcus phage S-B05]|nr:baseplate wedge subunit [Synechococcus phage S-B05]QCW22833.1 baseplate wedge subunit [Synechococcus phage S-B05]QDH50499.1 baseplate wedge subunit [Synechococcus phage S-B43]